jgi:hypothetical protein
MDDFALAQSQAGKLRKHVMGAGYSRTGGFSENVHEVVEVLTQIVDAGSVDDIPQQVGGVYYFKSVDVERELGLDGFASEFRKIHVVLGRDVEMERRLIDTEEDVNEKYGADVARQLDEQHRPR